MNRIVSIALSVPPPFGQSLPACFGGEPGWLAAAVPPNTQFDFVGGRIVGPGFSLARTPSGKWIPTQ